MSSGELAVSFGGAWRGRHGWFCLGGLKFVWVVLGMAGKASHDMLR